MLVFSVSPAFFSLGDLSGLRPERWAESLIKLSRLSVGRDQIDQFLAVFIKGSAGHPFDLFQIGFSGRQANRDLDQIDAFRIGSRVWSWDSGKCPSAKIPCNWRRNFSLASRWTAIRACRCDGFRSWRDGKIEDD